MNWLRRLIRDRGEDVCVCGHPRGLHLVRTHLQGWVWTTACRALLILGEGEVDPESGMRPLEIADCHCPGFEAAA